MSVGVMDRAIGQTDGKDEKCPGENVSLLTAAVTGPRRWAELSRPLVDELSSGEACSSLRAERRSGDTATDMRLVRGCGWGSGFLHVCVHTFVSGQMQTRVYAPHVYSTCV